MNDRERFFCGLHSFPFGLIPALEIIASLLVVVLRGTARSMSGPRSLDSNYTTFSNEVSNK